MITLHTAAGQEINLGNGSGYTQDDIEQIANEENNHFWWHLEVCGFETQVLSRAIDHMNAVSKENMLELVQIAIDDMGQNAYDHNAKSYAESFDITYLKSSSFVTVSDYFEGYKFIESFQGESQLLENTAGVFGDYDINELYEEFCK